MEDERQPIDNLLEQVGLAFRKPVVGRTQFEDEAFRRGDLIVYRPEDGQNSYIATINPDFIFDENGNRFEEI